MGGNLFQIMEEVVKRSVVHRWLIGDSSLWMFGRSRRQLACKEKRFLSYTKDIAENNSTVKHIMVLAGK